MKYDIVILFYSIIYHQFYNIFYKKSCPYPPPPSKNKLPKLILVPNTLVLRGYAVTLLRVCYCIINCTQGVKALKIVLLHIMYNLVLLSV